MRRIRSTCVAWSILAGTSVARRGRSIRKELAGSRPTWHRPRVPEQAIRSRRGWGALAVALWLGYALPLFFPPAPTDCGAPLPADADLLARLFPGVPGWWVAARLVCVFAAALVAGLCGRHAVPERLPVAPEPAPPPASSLPIRIALAVAAAQLAAGVLASHFGRATQLLYVVALAAPALILWIGQTRGGCRTDRWALGSVMIVVAAWLLLRAPLAWHSPRTADAVDTLGAFTYLETAAPSSFNLLTD